MERAITGSFHVQAADRNALRPGTQLHLALKQLALEQKTRRLRH